MSMWFVIANQDALFYSCYVKMNTSAWWVKRWLLVWEEEGKSRSRLPRRSWRRLSSTLRRTRLVILVILLHRFADVILRHRRVIIDNLALVGATRTRACDRRWRAWWWRGSTSRHGRCLWWAWWLDATSGWRWLRRWSCVVGGNFGFRLFCLKIYNLILN